MAGLRFHRFDTVESTNDLALAMARESKPGGTIVIARRQTRGRGRQGRVWHDEPGAAVLMSLIASTDLESARAAPFAASLAVADCLRECCGIPDPQLKWPNDVLVRDRKIAGILVETASRPHPAVVVGIGVNVLQTSLTPEISQLATSIVLETGMELDVDELAELIAHTFFDLRDLRFEDILDQWRNYMWGVGRQADVTGEGRTVSGVISGVDSAGALLLADALGNVTSIVSAESVRISDN